MTERLKSVLWSREWVWGGLTGRERGARLDYMSGLLDETLPELRVENYQPPPGVKHTIGGGSPRAENYSYAMMWHRGEMSRRTRYRSSLVTPPSDGCPSTCRGFDRNKMARDTRD